MEVRVLERAQALQPGCSLWLVPDLASSRWTERLDWYLGFQIMKATDRPSLALSSELARVASANDVELPAITPIRSDAPMMLASESRLPAKNTVVVPFHGDVVAWLESCRKVWRDLREPAARIFWPDGLEGEAGFERLWPTAEVVRTAP